MTLPEYDNVKIVHGYTDVDPGGFAPSKFIEEAGAQWEALKEMFTSPRETLSGLRGAGAGILGGLIQPSPEQMDIEVQRLSDEEVPEEDAERMVYDRPSISTPQERQAASDLMETEVRHTSPAGLSDNAYRGLANLRLALPGGGILGAPRNISAFAQAAPKTAKALRGIERIADIIDPATVPFAALREAAPIVGRGARKGKEVLTTKIRDTRDRLGPILARADIPLKSELFANVMGFTMGTGATSIEKLMDKLGLNTPKFKQVFRASKLGKEIPETKNLLEDAATTMDTWQGKLKASYVNLRSEAFTGPDGIPNTKLVNTENMVKPIMAALNEFGMRARRVADEKGPIYVRDEAGNLSRIRYVVEGKPRETRVGPGGYEDVGEKVAGTGEQITKLGADRELVMAQFADFLNEPKATRDFAGGSLAHELHNMRMLLDDNISKLATEGASSRTRTILSNLRNIVRTALEDALGAPYEEAMSKYNYQRQLMERAESELGLRPGLIDRKGELDLRDHETTLNRLGNAFSGDDRILRTELLDQVAKFGGSDTLVPRTMGRIFSGLFGQGLVVKHETSQLMRTIVRGVTLTGTEGFLLSGDPMVAALLALPAAMVFSPRAGAMIIDRIVTNPALKSKIPAIKNKMKEPLAKLFDINRQTGGGLLSYVRETGMNYGQLLERLEQDIDSGSSDTGLPNEPAGANSKIKGIQAAKQDALGAR